MDGSRLVLEPLWRELRDAGACEGEYVLFGSAVLMLHGLRSRIGDVDLFVTRRLYDALTVGRGREHEPAPGDPPYLELRLGTGAPAHLFYAWQQRDPSVCVDAAFRHAEVVQGWPAIPLWLVGVHKRQALEIVRAAGVDPIGSRWEKHVHDLRAIEAALAA